MYTVTQVAKELKCSPQAIRNWIKDGSIKAIKLPNTGRKREFFRITAEEFERLKSGAAK